MNGNGVVLSDHNRGDDFVTFLVVGDILGQIGNDGLLPGGVDEGSFVERSMPIRQRALLTRASFRFLVRVEKVSAPLNHVLHQSFLGARVTENLTIGPIGMGESSRRLYAVNELLVLHQLRLLAELFRTKSALVN